MTGTCKKVLIPLPHYGFDPTEVAIPWHLLTQAGFEITFITPQGNKASADKLMLEGRRLGLWKPILRARKDAVEAYHKMEDSAEFCQPSAYNKVDAGQFDALLLPGGHDKGVREYLESSVLQALVVDFFVAGKPVAAICHGVVLAARSINPSNQQSVLYHYKTTALLKTQELLAYQLTRLWLQDYYLTYPDLCVEDEVTSVLSASNNFVQGPTPSFRDSPTQLQRGFVVQDKHYLSSRWPGDAYNFSLKFIDMINQTKGEAAAEVEV